MIYGINNLRKTKGKSVIHAEDDAFQKLNKYTSRKKHKKWSLVSLRVSKTGKLGMAKPCIHCLIECLKHKNDLKDVMYSLEDGTVVCESLDKLLKDDHYVTKSRGECRG